MAMRGTSLRNCSGILKGRMIVAAAGNCVSRAQGVRRTIICVQAPHRTPTVAGTLNVAINGDLEQ
jgi:hypothetical protein